MAKFHLADLMSIVTPKLFQAPERDHGIDGVYEICNFMLGKSHFTLELGEAAEVCKIELIKQHPFLAEIDATNVNRDNWREFQDEQVSKYGEYFEVQSI
jgi:hypothetical protein